MNEVNKVRSPQSMDSWKLITRADKPRISYPVYDIKKGSLNNLNLDHKIRFWWCCFVFVL